MTIKSLDYKIKNEKNAHSILHEYIIVTSTKEVLSVHLSVGLKGVA